MGPTGKRITAALIAVALLVGATGFALSQSLTNTSDVRIVAQKLEDGRIEFGLEQDGERILPRTRFFPADARVGRWLKSSPVTIEVEPVAASSANSSVLSARGRGDDYVSGGYASEGNYRCVTSVSGNDNQYGPDNFAVVSYGSDGSYGDLHANEIESSWSGTSRLTVGDSLFDDVAAGTVYFEVTAVGSWSIECERLN